MIELKNISPTKYTSINLDDTISFQVYDASGKLKQDTLEVYVNNDKILDADTFSSPFTGSSISTITDGYSITLDSSDYFYDFVTVRVVADNNDLESLDGYFGYLVEESVNVLYYSDAYGLNSIKVRDLAGDSESQVSVSLQTPDIPSNDINYITASVIDGYYCVVLSHAGTDGISVCRYEHENIESYNSGVTCGKSIMTDDGTLYIINEDSNRVDVYYGAHFRSGSRSPDFTYSSSSTPDVVAGTILEIYLTKNTSTVNSTSSRLYVGTSSGATLINAYDGQTDGYADGTDNLGESTHYGIVGSGIDNEVIGGAVASVTEITSNEDKKIVFFVTNDGAGNGGVTQVKIDTTTQIIFMSQANTLLPSDDVRDIFYKN